MHPLAQLGSRARYAVPMHIFPTPHPNIPVILRLSSQRKPPSAFSPQFRALAAGCACHMLMGCGRKARVVVLVALHLLSITHGALFIGCWVVGPRTGGAVPDDGAHPRAWG